MFEVTNMPHPSSDHNDNRDQELAWDELREEREGRQTRQRTPRRTTAEAGEDAPKQRPSGILKYPFLAYEFLSVTFGTLFVVGYFLVSGAIAVGFVIAVYSGLFDPTLRYKLEFVMRIFFASKTFEYLFVASAIVFYGFLILAGLTFIYDGLKKAYQRIA